MDITGKIIAVLEPRSGVSKSSGNSWKTQEFVIETHDQYPKKCVFNIFGEDKISQANINMGDELTVSFDIDAREWNGRWFNDIRAWRVEHTIAQAAGVSQAAPIAPASPIDMTPSSSGDDLPF